MDACHLQIVPINNFKRFFKALYSNPEFHFFSRPALPELIHSESIGGHDHIYPPGPVTLWQILQNMCLCETNRLLAIRISHTKDVIGPRFTGHRVEAVGAFAHVACGDGLHM